RALRLERRQGRPHGVRRQAQAAVPRALTEADRGSGGRRPMAHAMSAAALSIVGLAATSLACAPSCGASSARAPTASAPAGETVVDASSPREVESPPVPPAVDPSGPRAAEPSVPPSVTASAPLGPWAGL